MRRVALVPDVVDETQTSRNVQADRVWLLVAVEVPELAYHVIGVELAPDGKELPEGALLQEAKGRLAEASTLDRIQPEPAQVVVLLRVSVCLEQLADKPVVEVLHQAGVNGVPHRLGLVFPVFVFARFAPFLFAFGRAGMGCAVRAASTAARSGKAFTTASPRGMSC